MSAVDIDDDFSLDTPLYLSFGWRFERASEHTVLSIFYSIWCLFVTYMGV
jgi:hypothetical protein